MSQQDLVVLYHSKSCFDSISREFFNVLGNQLLKSTYAIIFQVCHALSFNMSSLPLWGRLVDAVPSKTDGKGLKSWAPAAMNPNHYRIMIHTHTHIIYYIYMHRNIEPIAGDIPHSRVEHPCHSQTAVLVCINTYTYYIYIYMYIIHIEYIYIWMIYDMSQSVVIH